MTPLNSATAPVIQYNSNLGTAEKRFCKYTRLRRILYILPEFN